MSVLMLATVGEDTDPVMLGVRDHAVRRLVMFHLPAHAGQAQDVRAKLEAIHIDVRAVEVDPKNVLMDTLEKVQRVALEDGLGFKDIILNVSSGDKMVTCSALSAAFVNGIPAIGIGADGPFSLPVLKFSYQELVSDAKFRILEALQASGGKAGSLAELSQSSSVEKSLLSYHLRTTREGKGLEELGLVSIQRGSLGRLKISLSEMGSLLLAGRR